MRMMKKMMEMRTKMMTRTWLCMTLMKGKKVPVMRAKILKMKRLNRE